MNRKKFACVILVAMGLLLGNTLPGNAHGFRGRPRTFVGARVFIGPLWWGPGPWWWGSPYYASPPVVIREQPSVYIQEAPQPGADTYWYYCPAPQGYYPYIKECPQGWMKVVPPSTPPGR